MTRLCEVARITTAEPLCCGCDPGSGRLCFTARRLKREADRAHDRARSRQYERALDRLVSHLFRLSEEGVVS